MKIVGAQVLGPDFRFHDYTVEVQGDTITALTEAASQETSCDVVSYQGLKLIPGLIDTHMHGYYGKQCSSKDPEDLAVISYRLALEGVTGYAATISTSPDERALAGIRSCRLAAEKDEGSQLLAIHMEGPFMNPVKKGAMNAEYMQLPSKELLDAYLNEGGDLIRLMTMAPELEGTQEFAEYAIKKGVTLSMGHTFATRQEAMNAVTWGIRRATHTFNAMRPLDHRESGVLGAVLMDDSVQCEMIADFVHVSPEVCQMIYKLKGADRVTLISDSCSLAGLKQEDLPEDMPYIIGKAAYLKNGTLCGSVGTVMTCVRNMISIGVPVEEAVKMASYNPARDLGVEDHLGSIDVGKWATFVLVDDELNVKAVYVKGKLIQ